MDADPEPLDHPVGRRPVARRPVALRPRALPPGGTVALIAPAGACPVEEAEAAKAWWEARGYRARLGPNACRRWGYLAGGDRERAEDFVAAWLDPEVDAILCLRGGYGSMRLLEHVDWEAVRQAAAARPRPFVGFSDVTALHGALWNRANLVTFHGPMAAAMGAEPEAAENGRRLLEALAGQGPAGRGGEVVNPAGGPGLQSLAPGEGSGPLVGGNLSLICATLGTPWEIDTEGAVLVLEDVDEAPYRLDRMLTQLLLAGKLQQASAVVVGELAGCEPPPGRPSLTVEEVLADRLGALGLPVLTGLCCGHGRFRLTLPLGVRARVACGPAGGEGRLWLEEAAVGA